MNAEKLIRGHRSAVSLINTHKYTPAVKRGSDCRKSQIQSRNQRDKNGGQGVKSVAGISLPQALYFTKGFIERLTPRC